MLLRMVDVPRVHEYRRAALRAHYEVVLSALGIRLRRNGFRQETLDDAAIVLAPARDAGLTMREIGSALGFEPAEVLALARQRGSERHARLRVLASLGARGSLRPSQLGAVLGWDKHWTEQMIAELAGERLIQALFAGYTAAEEPYWTLTDRGEEELRWECGRLGMPELARYATYLSLSEREAAVLEKVATRRLGLERATILRPALTSISGGIRGPELTLVLLATSRGDAAARADCLFRELLEAAGLPARSATFADLTPLDPPHVAAA
jgi:DNA-binding MarR family transcriptional regulator